MLDLDVSYLLKLVEGVAADYGWERLILWATAALVTVRYLWRPVRAVAGWYWRMISAPFRPAPEDTLVAGILQTIRTRESDWDAGTRELLAGNVLITLGTSWRAAGYAANDLTSIKIGGSEAVADFSDPQRIKIVTAAKNVIHTIEAKDRERRRGELLVRLKSDDVPLVAGMSHPLKKDKKGA